DQSVVRANVRYRTGIQSDIVGKRVDNCGGEPIATLIVDVDALPSSTLPPPPLPTPLSIATPLPTPPTLVPPTPTTAPPTVVLGPNLISNGDFESPLNGSGWEWGGQVESIAGYNSNLAVRSVKAANDGFGWVGLVQEVPVT